MYNEFYQHKKSDAVKWIAVLIALIVLAVGVVAALIPLYYAQDESKDDVQQQETPIAMNPVTENGIKLSMSTMSTVSEDKVTATVTATITPDDAVNKEVDWSIAWAGDAELSAEPIENYLRVVPQSDGSLIATIECYKSFRGSTAIVTVTARDGGASAVVIVSFKGIPAELNINTTSLSTQLRGNVSCFIVSTNRTNELDISLSNIFDDIDESYGNYTVSVKGVGSFIVGDFSTNVTGAETWTNEETITLDSVKDDFITASISGDVLTIEALGRYENTRGNTVGGSYGAITYNLFKQDVTESGGALPHYEITVTDVASKLSKTIKVYVNAGVSNISVNRPSVEF